MHSSADLSRSSGHSGRAVATLVAVAAALAAALIVGPPELAANGSSGDLVGELHLTDAFRHAFIGYWQSGDRGFSLALTRVVDYWFRFHVAKLVIAALLLTVLVALGVRLCRAFLRADGARSSVVFASAGVLVAVLAVLSLVTVMANLQGAVAPFASMMPLLLGGTTDPELTGTLAQIRQRLAEAQHAGGPTPPPTHAMIADFARYHVALAVTAAIVALVLIGVSVVLLRRVGTTVSSDRATRRLLGLLGAFSVLLALITIVVAVANTSTATNPTPAFMAFLEGGH